MDLHRVPDREGGRLRAREDGRLRAFFAIALPPAARRAVGARVEELRGRVGGERVRWVREENLHVTLRFLGDVDAGSLDALLARVEEQVAPLAPFALRLGDPRPFPSRRRPQVIALPVEPEAPLSALAAAVERGVVAAGLPAEPRPFRSHLTLGRIRSRERGPDVTGPDTADADPVPVTEVVLFQSELGRGGPRYTRIGSVPLGRTGSAR